MRGRSALIYGTAQTVPITRGAPLGVRGAIAASKIGADKLVDSFHRCHGLPTVVLRPFKTYGHRLLSDAARANSLCRWSPQVSLEDGLRRTVDWIDRHQARFQGR